MKSLNKKTAMRTLWVGIGLAALGMTAPASAADMAVKAPPPPPPLPVIFNWTGFYIGANGGWASSHNCWDYVFIAGPIVSDGCRDRSGGVLGGQIGYRWQSNQWVFGLEAQGDWADITSTRVSVLDPTISTRAKTDGIGLFTGQIGWAGWSSALLYVKGGAAVTGNRFDIFRNTTGATLFSASATRWGGTLGVGLEYAFSPNWSVGVEYDHLWMGRANITFPATTQVSAGFLNDRISQDVDMVTLRVNYRFGWGAAAPVTARY